MTSFFGLHGRKPASSSVSVAAPLGENFAPPALKVAAGMDKPGAMAPVHGRRTLGDITNENRTRIAGAKPTVPLVSHNSSFIAASRPAPLAHHPTNLGIYGVPAQHVQPAVAHAMPLVHAASIAPTHRADLVLSSVVVAQPQAAVSALEALVPPEPMMIDKIQNGMLLSQAPQAGNETIPTVCPEDIDAYDTEDPQFCTDYVTEIYQYLRQKEVEDRIDPLYMTKQQRDLNDKMRGILVDWMVEVHLKFKLLTETLYLSVGIVDKYLQKKAVDRRHLQLVGITAMLIATKFEEIYSIEIADFIYVADNAYTREEMIKMEKDILVNIGFCLSSPAPLHFLRRFSKAAKNDSHTHTLAKYLIEMSLPEYRMLEYLPSQLAAGAVYLARYMMKTPPVWTPTLSFYTRYSEEQARNYAKELQMIIKNTKSTFKAIRKKYANPKLMEVAKIPAGDDL